MRNEDLRRKVNLIVVWVSWSAAFGFTFCIVSGMLPRTLGTMVVMFIGIGVTSSLIRSRYRLADTISEVFLTGMRLVREEREQDGLSNEPKVTESKDR